MIHLGQCLQLKNAVPIDVHSSFLHFFISSFLHFFISSCFIYIHLASHPMAALSDPTISLPAKHIWGLMVQPSNRTLFHTTLGVLLASTMKWIMWVSGLRKENLQLLHIRFCSRGIIPLILLWSFVISWCPSVLEAMMQNDAKWWLIQCDMSRVQF